MSFPKDYWKEEIERTKLDIEFLCGIIKKCKEPEKERFKSILGNVLWVYMNEQELLEKEINNDRNQS